MHKRGRQIWTTIKRNNTETIELGRINHYSFHHQVSQVLVTPFESLVNDSVTTACVFDTSADSAAVSFGYSSNDEMCFNFVEYYPDSQQGLINSGNPPSIAIDTARDSANCDVDPISVVARNFQTDITLTILVALMGLMFFTI
jgi:hypothetical protein